MRAGQLVITLVLVVVGATRDAQGLRQGQAESPTYVGQALSLSVSIAPAGGKTILPRQGGSRSG